MAARQREIERLGAADARRTGVLPPEHWRAPARAPLSALARTTRVWARVARHVVPAFVRARALPDAQRELSGRRTLAAWALRELGVALEVEGEAHVPAAGGCIVMWNQTSHLDHFVLSAVLPRSVLTLYNNEVARLPLYGNYLARRGHFHVDRFDEAQWRASLARAAEAVQAGACVLVSPEGTRSWDGRLLAMKRGAFMLARAAERPLICVAVHGAHTCLPRGAYAVRPGTIRVVVHAPLAVRADDAALEERVTRLLTVR
jgi:1-acyl-sn-glycerol-3-phosphate acyltransferase